MSKFVTISSKDLTSGNRSNFVVRFAAPLERISRIKIEQVMIPATWFTIMSGINDKIYIYVATVLYTATLTEGVYTATSLNAEMQTQMNAAYTPDNNFTVTLSALTYKYTFTHSGTNFQLTFATNTTATARKLLGFDEEDTTAGLSVEATNVYNLGHSENLYIISNTLGINLCMVGNVKNKIIFVTPANANFGTYITYIAGHENEWGINYRHGQSFHDCDFKLVFDDLTTEVPLNGNDWSITMLYD